MRLKNSILFGRCSIAILIGCLGSALGAGPSLEEVLSATKKNNAQVKEALGEVEVARAQLARAKAAVYPKAQALMLAAPMVEIRGNALQSTTNFSKFGALLRGGLSIVQPLHTFGQISNYKKAAENQITARKEQANMKRAEMVMLAKEFYYGYGLASDLLSLVENLVDFLEEAVETAEQNIKKEKSTVKPHDLYRLKTELADLKQKKLYAKAAKQTAAKAVAWVSGLEFETLPKKKLRPQKFEIKPVEHFLSLASANRPGLKALKAGQVARAALRDAKRAQSYPVLFVGGFFSQSWSNVVDNQPSAFANDPFNTTEGGFGFGLKFDLEFWRHSAEASEEEAERIKLKAKEEYAVPGIALEVRKAYWEVEQALEGLKIAKQRKRDSKKWFISSAMGWSIGITKAKDLMEALEGDGKAKKNYIETVYALNMALANLSKASGVEVTDLNY